MNNQKYSNVIQGDNILIQCSKESIRRFIKLVLSINPTPYWFHQTLTFNPKIYNPTIAKNYLKQLLDALEKAYPEMGTFFTIGNHKKEGFHFHVIFLFYAPQKKSPEAMLEDYSEEVYQRWNEIQGGTLTRRANQMRLRTKERCIAYLLGHFAIADKPLPRNVHWHGTRNKDLIHTNSAPASKQSITEKFREIFPKSRKRKSLSESLPRFFTKAQMKREKEWVEEANEMDWASYKQSVLKTKNRVSDKDYQRFKNKKETQCSKK